MQSSRIFLIAMVVAAALVAATATALAQGTGAQSRDGRASDAPLGIDPAEGKCPRAEPQKLPPGAVAGATRAALSSAPDLYGGGTEGRYAEAAYRGMKAPVNKFYKNACAHRQEYGKRLQRRSVQVDMVFPEYGPSASLSQHWVFVARFDGEYRVWGVYR